MYSALIRTYNSEETLEQNLESLRNQSVPPTEILVVDSGSKDSTLEIAERYQCRIIHYPKGEKFNYSKSLNIGFKEAKYEKVLVISSHTILYYPDIAERMSAALDYFDACGVWCCYMRSLSNVKEAARKPLRGKEQMVTHLSNFHGGNGLSNSCSMVLRSLWEACPFNESLEACEDQEWALRQYKSSNKPTVRIRGAGVWNLNTNYNDAKLIRDKVIVDTIILPENSSASALLRKTKEAIKLLAKGKTKEALFQAKLIAAIKRKKRELQKHPVAD